MSAAEKLARPQVQHGITSPDLVGYLPTSSISLDSPNAALATGAANPEKNSSSEKSTNAGADRTPAQALLHRLTSRQNDDYRHMVFAPATGANAQNFDQRVSFDTINLRAAEDPTLSFLDDAARAELLASRRRMLAETADARGRGLDRDFLLVRSPGASPSGSPTRMRSPHRSLDVSTFFRSQIQYPTVPILTRKCCTLTRLHQDFEPLYLGQLAEYGLWPALRGRVIMVYVSGRKHTWVAIDWILCNFVQHGDTVVIVAAINHPLAPAGSRTTWYPPPQAYPPKTEKVRQRQRNRPEYTKQIAANIMHYALSVVNPNAIVKITVELAEGKTKDVLKDMYKLYEPNIVSTGSKASARNSAPLKSWTSSRLSDRLVRIFPLPVIVVPAPNMGPFERKLSAAVASLHELNSVSRLASPEITGADASSSERLPQDSDSHDRRAVDSDAESISDRSFKSQSSTDSEASANSYNSFDEIADLYSDYKTTMDAKLAQHRKRDIDENYFANFIKTISDLSLRFCGELKDVNPNFRGQGAKLAREITGSNSFGAVPYKTKSLLPPIEKSITGSSSGGMSYSELKRNLKKNTLQAKQGPLIKIDPPASPLEAPKALALKFAEGEKPSRRMKSDKLQKFLSHEDLSNRRVNLEPSKSQPDLTQVFGEEKKKKKKKKFWKLF
ncbi:hypothetical protein METBIDRAFT_33404 [Metschnikowia bicuspidata var. bicuspidata NRRL YB-4993]|uniref:UspA domain-containing protein n=1 Tax=Metschnikowia bicuspidata var. bicuspidata NRRL YB-4993 TaxID=869754 RepID=A0A1A0H5L8_9ASCO|nr:hypothetical protein METBIDRAFT_33404 [Metschnikowia bicuspidata var. bicuspidata NRRL YB-4993]OBA19192.1 hypothetical protein METBIDRAFT_33404 [Metschnikowia bicuspidata var. bicuspidata NRRL YB-4993]